jgi:hypothetical protein
MLHSPLNEFTAGARHRAVLGYQHVNPVKATTDIKVAEVLLAVWRQQPPAWPGPWALPRSTCMPVL